MDRTIQDVIEALLEQIKDYGSKKPTLHLYKDVCHSLVKHCNKKVDDPYTEQLPDESLRKAEECYKNGIHCYEYYRFIQRTIRLIKTFAITGKPDFSHQRKSKKYVPSSKHLCLIKKIAYLKRISL